MRTSVLTLTLTLLCMALWSAPSSAGGDRDQGIFKELNLSSEQKQKLKEIKKADKEKTKALRQSKRTLKEQLREGMKSDMSDEDLRKINSELNEVLAELKQLKFEKILSIRALLNQEQRAKFNELHSKRMGNFRHKWKERQKK